MAAAAFTAVVLAGLVLFLMESPDPETVELPAAVADTSDSVAWEGPAWACCYDDAEWRGDAESPVIDFTDPTTGGIIPLMNVEGRYDERLSPNLRVGDLAARDGAPYARISVELVGALENVISSTDKQIVVASGYRHPARNALAEIGGSSESQHMAGRAADISSPDMAPLDLATLVLDVLGCRIGLGLGDTFVHVDVRGRRSAWAAEDAAMTADEFRSWVGQQCGDTPSEVEDEEPGVDEVLANYEEEMTQVARQLLEAGVEGGVALDLREEDPSPYAVPSGTPDATGLGLQSLIETAVSGRYFAFACVVDDDEVVRGFMRY